MDALQAKPEVLPSSVVRIRSHSRLVSPSSCSFLLVPLTSLKVYVMGATNAVHMLDPDLLRPGRFDHVIQQFVVQQLLVTSAQVIQVKLPDLEARRYC